MFLQNANDKFAKAHFEPQLRKPQNKFRWMKVDRDSPDRLFRKDQGSVIFDSSDLSIKGFLLLDSQVHESPQTPIAILLRSATPNPESLKYGNGVGSGHGKEFHVRGVPGEILLNL